MWLLSRCVAAHEAYLTPPPNSPPHHLQRYRLGQRLHARVLGFRPMDGLAALSLKPSVVDQHILSLAGEPGLEAPSV